MNKALLDALSRLVEAGPRQNEYFVVGISSSPILLLDGTEDTDTTLAALSEIGKMKPEGASAFYDACHLALTKVLAGRHPRKFMLVFSDGEDTISDRPFKQVLDLLENKGVTVYAVNVRKPDNINALKAVGVLEKMTSLTGGTIFNAYEPERLGRAFEEIEGKLWK